MSDAQENARLDALHWLDLLATPPSEAFDRITRMASQIFDVPIAAISLTDRDRQWFKSRVGVEHRSIPRDKAPCAKVAESAGTVLIPDLLADDCYSESNLARQGVGSTPARRWSRVEASAWARFACSGFRLGQPAKPRCRTSATLRRW